MCYTLCTDKTRTVLNADFNSCSKSKLQTLLSVFEMFVKLLSIGISNPFPTPYKLYAFNAKSCFKGLPKRQILHAFFFHCRSIKCAPYFQYNSSMTFSTFQPYDIDTLDNEYTFHHQKFGRNIQLSHKDTIACRTTGYNQAIVISSKPLQINNPIEVENYTGRQ